MSPELERLLSATKMRVRARSPYLAVLAGYLETEKSMAIAAAATDGKTMYVNPEFWSKLAPPHRDFVFLHELLHSALGHPYRTGGREPRLWNIACDFVVNLILAEGGYTRPPGILCDSSFKNMSAEEVYALLLKNSITVSLPMADLIAGSGSEKSETSAEQLDAYWRGAMSAAEVTAKMHNRGDDPLMRRLSISVQESKRDWREYLWQILPTERNDFGSFDSRLLHLGLYVEDLIEDDRGQLTCGIFVDTSGSTQDILGKFTGEIEQIVSLYPRLEVKLYWVDVGVKGPVPLDREHLEHPRGGGGTSFIKAFKLAEKEQFKHVLFLTDLNATLPEKIPPGMDVIWAVPAGTVATAPFGKVLKIL